MHRSNMIMAVLATAILCSCGPKWQSQEADGYKLITQGGPADIAYRNCQEALGYLKAAGIKYDYMENAQAGHSWTTWRADLQVLAPTLFK